MKGGRFNMNRLRQLRIESHRNMRETARLLGIPYTTYINYEKGLREPNSEMLVALANFYNVSVDYLICRSDSTSAPKNEENIFDRYDNISPIKLKKFPLLGEIAWRTDIRRRR